MNHLFSSIVLTAGAGIVAVGAIGIPDFGGSDSVARDEITGSIKGDRQGVFTLASSGEANCIVRRGEKVGPGTFRLAVSTQCADILDGLESIIYWSDVDGGGIVFSGANGPVIEFAEADGAEYESVAPAKPLFSLDSGITDRD